MRLYGTLTTWLSIIDLFCSSHPCAKGSNYKYLIGKVLHSLCSIVYRTNSVTFASVRCSWVHTKIEALLRGSVFQAILCNCLSLFNTFILGHWLSMSLIIVDVHVVFDPRDRLTADDCIGTGYLPISAISGQGDDGKHMLYSLKLFTLRGEQWSFNGDSGQQK